MVMESFDEYFLEHLYLVINPDYLKEFEQLHVKEIPILVESA